MSLSKLNGVSASSIAKINGISKSSIAKINGINFAVENTYSIDLEKSSSQYLSITDASQTGLDFTSDLTFSFWAKPESVVGTAGDRFQFVSKYLTTAGAGQASYQFRYADVGGTKKLELILSSDGSTNETYSVSSDLGTGTWKYITVSWDASASTAKFYVNGSQTGGDQTGSLTSIFNGTAGFSLGTIDQGSGGQFQFYDGLMDEVGVWSRELTSSEVSSLYNSGNGLVYDDMSSSLKTDLEGYWDLNNRLTDRTSNGNTLTNNNSATFSTDTPF